LFFISFSLKISQELLLNSISSDGTILVSFLKSKNGVFLIIINHSKKMMSKATIHTEFNITGDDFLMLFFLNDICVFFFKKMDLFY